MTLRQYTEVDIDATTFRYTLNGRLNTSEIILFCHNYYYYYTFKICYCSCFQCYWESNSTWTIFNLLQRSFVQQVRMHIWWRVGLDTPPGGGIIMMHATVSYFRFYDMVVSFPINNIRIVHTSRAECFAFEVKVYIFIAVNCTTQKLDCKLLTAHILFFKTYFICIIIAFDSFILDYIYFCTWFWQDKLPLAWNTSRAVM